LLDIGTIALAFFAFDCLVVAFFLGLFKSGKSPSLY
jgi:hypothetical protein